MVYKVNTTTPQAALRMVAMYSGRHFNPAKSGEPKIGATFMVRIPSYGEMPPAWRDRVLHAVAVLTEGFPKQNNRHDWKVGEYAHTTYAFTIGEAASGYQKLTKRIPAVLDILFYGEVHEETKNMYAQLFQSEMDILKTLDPEGKEYRTCLSTTLSKMALIFQYPYVIDCDSQHMDARSINEEAVDLYRILSSQDFLMQMNGTGGWKDQGLVQACAFSISPYPLTCRDSFLLRGADKKPSTVKSANTILIKLGWDFLLNARPLGDAICTALASKEIWQSHGLAFPVFVRKNTSVIGKGADGEARYTGDPLGIESMSGESIKIVVPQTSPLKGGVEEFVSIVYHAVAPYIHTALPASVRNGLLPIKALSKEGQECIAALHRHIEDNSDIYKTYQIQEKTMAGHKENGQRKSINTDPRIIPYPNKTQIYIIVPEHENVRNAINAYVANDKRLGSPRWNVGKHYTSVYIHPLPEDQGGVNGFMTSFEERRLVAKQLAAYVREQTDVILPVEQPDAMHLRLVVKGRTGQGQKGKKWLMFEIPVPFDKDTIRMVAKKKITLSDESLFLKDVKKAMDSKIASSFDIEDIDALEDINDMDGFVIDGVGEMEEVEKTQTRIVWGIDITDIAKDREAQEQALSIVKERLMKDIVGPAQTAHGVDATITCSFSSDEKRFRMERDLLARLQTWKKRILDLEKEDICLNPMDIGM